MDSLKKARLLINKIDRDMAKLFEERMNAVKEVAAYKIENNLPVFDKNREKELIKANESLVPEEILPYYRPFLNTILQESKRFQNNMMNSFPTAYQGTEGAYSHIAAQNLYPDSPLKSYTTFKEVFEAVKNDKVSRGVIPFENSYAGEVGEVVDLLFKYDLYVTDIYDLKINHNLLGVKGSKISDIKQVYSKDQALSQCGNFFDKYDFELIPYTNTALAAKYVSELNDKSKAAVASIETASLYDLEVLKANINTSDENTTRFVVISKTQNSFGNRFSLMFTLDHSAGQLANVMQIIGSYGFNMESIRSKSLRDKAWQYYFYVEIVGDISSNKAKLMLKDLEKICKEFKVLGVYEK